MKRVIQAMAILMVATMTLFVPTSCAACDNDTQATVDVTIATTIEASTTTTTTATTTTTTTATTTTATSPQTPLEGTWISGNTEITFSESSFNVRWVEEAVSLPIAGGGFRPRPAGYSLGTQQVRFPFRGQVDTDSSVLTEAETPHPDGFGFRTVTRHTVSGTFTISGELIEFLDNRGSFY